MTAFILMSPLKLHTSPGHHFHGSPLDSETDQFTISIKIFKSFLSFYFLVFPLKKMVLPHSCVWNSFDSLSLPTSHLYLSTISQTPWPSEDTLPIKRVLFAWCLYREVLFSFLWAQYLVAAFCDMSYSWISGDDAPQHPMFSLLNFIGSRLWLQVLGVI